MNYEELKARVGRRRDMLNLIGDIVFSLYAVDVYAVTDSDGPKSSVERDALALADALTEKFDNVAEFREFLLSALDLDGETPTPTVHPCVYCGSDEVDVLTASDMLGEKGPIHAHYVACDICGSHGSYRATTDSAIKAWNEEQDVARNARGL